MTNEKMKRDRALFLEYKAGATKALLKRKYALSVTSVDTIIRRQQWYEQNGATEWIYQMSNSLATWLLMNGIKTPEDVYNKIKNSKGYMAGHNIGPKVITELNSHISQEVRVSQVDGNHKRLSFGKQPIPEQMRRRISGVFKGTVNGRHIEGEIDGEYISAAAVRKKIQEPEA